MINNSIPSLLGTLGTFVIGFMSYVLSLAFSSTPLVQLGVYCLIAIIASTLTMNFLQKLGQRQSISFFDYLMWFTVITIIVAVGPLVANQFLVGFAIAVVFALIMLSGMLIGYLGYREVSKGGEASLPPGILMNI